MQDPGRSAPGDLPPRHILVRAHFSRKPEDPPPCGWTASGDGSPLTLNPDFDGHDIPDEDTTGASTALAGVLLGAASKP